MNIESPDLRTYIRILLVGAAMGVANIIPGVSGGTIAVVFGIYGVLMESLGNFYSNKQKRFIYIRFLAVLFIGSVIAIVSLARVLSWSFEYYPIATVYFFIGLIIGSIPVVIKTHDNMKITLARSISFLIALTFVVYLAFVQAAKGGQIATGFDHTLFGLFDYIYYFFSGSIAAAAMIIPGVSGSFILLMLGIYWTVLSSLSGLTSTFLSDGLSNEMIVRLTLLASLGFGVIFGILLISRFINWALKNYPAVTMYAILGLITGSIYQIMDGVHFQFSAIALITLITGCLISLKFGKE